MTATGLYPQGIAIVDGAGRTMNGPQVAERTGRAHKLGRVVERNPDPEIVARVLVAATPVVVLPGVAVVHQGGTVWIRSTGIV
jgi:hypothetical protein